MLDKDEHLRGIAGELFALMPLDHSDAMKVIDHLKFLTEWRRRGVSVLNAPRQDGDGNGGPNGTELRHNQSRDTDNPLAGARPSNRNVSILKPRTSPLRT